MSFPRGPRFEPQQTSDVPGPNYYDLCQESQLTAYKRGAFLDKAERFSKDTPEGLGDYDNAKTGSKPNSKPPDFEDRYAVLQRKVEDLEKIHHEGKKAHQTEVDRLKFELGRNQKASAEHVDRAEKLKKQNAILEARVEDLKKASSTQQVELKDLRVKLKMSEHECTQLSAKQSQAGEIRKAMQSLESRRRDEAREKDRKIAELEKSATGEKKRREIAEARLHELQGKDDIELQGAREMCHLLQEQLTHSQEETQMTAQLLAAAESDAAAKQSSNLEHLRQQQFLLHTAAEEYGRLAAETIPIMAHEELKHKYGVLQIRTWRLERRLANSQDQIIELAELVRHAHDANILLKRQILDFEEECNFYARSLADRPQVTHPPDSLYDDLTSAMHDLYESELSTCQSNGALVASLAELYHLACDELNGAYIYVNTEHDRGRRISEGLRVELSDARGAQEGLKAELSKLHQERDDLSNQLSASARTLEESMASKMKAEQRGLEIEQEMKVLLQRTEAAAVSDKKAVQHLTETVKMSRMTEEGLRAEINTLTAELAESEQFQAAYYSLSDEVKSLIARKELAEGEAHQLSKFNAEILGHHNPAQRIVYVDRIRRELAETKHKLALTVVDLESARSQNAEFVRELEVYKSVPSDDKSRTVVTRILRPPLSALNQSTPPATANVNWEIANVGKRSEEFSFAI
ncbi:hypothetical protein GGX14DRAFT_520769 [Mycena pura]|uniref:Uncharacterized protein n=1 Tax=Mycena pura TaxID=153505 RepID=A0AAD6VEZ2_9AGAR|nr:hypothetical protein GGX14DRAFT_520769 [Mycena pura]